MDADKFLIKYSGSFSTDQSTSTGGPVSQVEPTYLRNTELGEIVSGVPTPGITVIRARRGYNGSGTLKAEGAVEFDINVNKFTGPINYQVSCFVKWAGEGSFTAIPAAWFDASFENTVRTVVLSGSGGDSSTYLVLEIDFNILDTYNSASYLVDASYVLSSDEFDKAMGGYVTPMCIAAFEAARQFPAADYIRHDGAIRLAFASGMREYAGTGTDYSLRFWVTWGVGEATLNVSGFSPSATLSTVGKVFTLGTGVQYLHFLWPAQEAQCTFVVDTDYIDTLVYRRNGGTVGDATSSNVYLTSTPVSRCFPDIYSGSLPTNRGYYVLNTSDILQSLTMLCTSVAETTYMAYADTLAEAPDYMEYVGDGITSSILTSPHPTQYEPVSDGIRTIGDIPSGMYLGFWLRGFNAYAGAVVEDVVSLELRVPI